MKIVFATSDNNLSSGAFNSCVFLAKELIAVKNEASVVVPCDGDGVQLLIEHSIPFRKIESEDWVVCNFDTKEDKIKKLKRIIRVNRVALKKWRQLLREEKPDILHINTTYHFIAAVAAIGTKTKVVWHLREFLEEDQDRHILKRALGLKLINRSAAIICISQAIYDKYRDVFNRKKMFMVHNGISIEKYYSKRKIFSRKEIRMLCVGGLWEKKGQFELVEGIGKYRTKYHDDNFILNLVGDYDQVAKDRVTALCEKYHLDGRVVLCGRQKDTPRYYRDSDIVFMSSINEAFGRVTVEGMLSGNLVIGKSCAGTEEIIQNKKTGLIYTGLNDLPETIYAAIKDKKASRELAKAGQESAMRNFTAQLNCQRVIGVYEKILGISVTSSEK